MCLGIPGQIVKITDEAANLAIADVSGVRRELNITCIRQDGRPAADHLGEWVLIHVGFAMSVIDEAEAAATLETLHQLGEVQAELDAIRAARAM